MQSQLYTHFSRLLPQKRISKRSPFGPSSAKIDTYLFTIQFQGSTAAEEAIGTQSFKLMPNSTEIKINLGNAFTGLTAAQAEAINGNVSWKTDKKFLIENLNANQITYYSDESCAIDKKVELTASTIRNIKYATIALKNITAFDQLVDDAAAGTSKITITMTDGVNEVKKVTTDLEVSLPTFDELFDKASSVDVWSDGICSLRLAANTGGAPKMDMATAFIPKNGNGAVIDANFDVKIANVGSTAVFDNINSGMVVLKDMVKDNALITKELTVNAIYSIAGKEKLAVETGDFTVKIQSIFEGAKLVYYVDDAIVDMAKVENNIISSMTITDNKKNGLAIQFGTDEKAFSSNATISFLNANVPAWNNNTLSTPGGLTNIDRIYAVSGIGNVTAEGDGANIKLGGTGYNGQQGTLVVTFRDACGVNTKAEIPFK